MKGVDGCGRLAERHLLPVGKNWLVAFGGNLCSVPARKCGGDVRRGTAGGLEAGAGAGRSCGVVPAAVGVTGDVDAVLHHRLGFPSASPGCLLRPLLGGSQQTHSPGVIAGSGTLPTARLKSGQSTIGS